MTERFYDQFGEATQVLLVLSLILFAGFLVTRITKKLRLPDVSGYILAGILIGPCCMGLVPAGMLERMGFISDIALAFIAFGTGRFFKKSALGGAGAGIVVLTLFESLFAGVLTALVLRLIFRMDWSLAILLGAIATATAPASTMMTIRQHRAKGPFIQTLLQVVALDDAVCLLVFSCVAAVLSMGAGAGSPVWGIVKPILFNLGAIGLGVGGGFLLKKLLSPRRSHDNRLILSVAMLLGISGICAAIEVSPLLACMAFGMAYANLAEDDAVFDQVGDFAPPVTAMFFILSGMKLALPALGTAGLVGLCYFAVRIIGKYAGAYIGGCVTRQPRETRRLLGLALVPQAGVAIGLAFLAQRILPNEMGDVLLAIILASSVLYEMLGPWCAQRAILRSGSVPAAHDVLPPDEHETEAAKADGEVAHKTI